MQVPGVPREGDISDHSTVYIILEFITDQAPHIKQFRDDNEVCI